MSSLNMQYNCTDFLYCRRENSFWMWKVWFFFWWSTTVL